MRLEPVSEYTARDEAGDLWVRQYGDMWASAAQMCKSLTMNRELSNVLSPEQWDVFLSDEVLWPKAAA